MRISGALPPVALRALTTTAAELMLPSSLRTYCPAVELIPLPMITGEPLLIAFRVRRLVSPQTPSDPPFAILRSPEVTVIVGDATTP